MIPTWEEFVVGKKENMQKSMIGTTGRWIFFSPKMKTNSLLQ